MTKKSENNRPTHTIYQVQGEGEQARWTKIGAAWVHKDNKGSNLKFDAFPLTGRVVIREATEQDSDEEKGGGQQ